ncbi:MAG: M23 family metallopeptidase [Clostridia bacterium]
MAAKKGKIQSVKEAVLRSVQKVASGGKSASRRSSATGTSSAKTGSSGSKNGGSISQRLNRELYEQTLFPKTESPQGLKRIDLTNQKKNDVTAGKSEKKEVKAKKITLPVLSSSGIQKFSEPVSASASRWMEMYNSRSVLPVSDFSVSSVYGVDRGTHRHSGIDLAVPEGTTVSAVKKGTVSFAGWGNGYGYRIVIDHGDGTQTTYNHLSDIGVKVGDTVNAGSAIALSGDTGNSTGPHLHFEVKKDGRYVDPALYFDFENGTTVKNDGAYTSQMASVSSGKSASSRKSSSSSSKRRSSSAAKKVVLPSVKYSAPAEKIYFDASLPSVEKFSFETTATHPSFSSDMNPLLALIPSYRIQQKTTKKNS